MKTTYLTVSAAVIALLVTAPAAFALPPVDDDPIPHCPPGYILVDDICVKRPTPPPPPPSNSPAIELNLARQSTNAQSVRITGRATDADQPATALTVHISVDGVFKRTVVANLTDPPVATQGFAAVPPPTIPGHRFDATVPAPANAQQVCVTAVNVGATGANKTSCKAIDNVVEFSANSLNYNVALAKITGATPGGARPGRPHERRRTCSRARRSPGRRSTTDTHTWSATGASRSRSRPGRHPVRRRSTEITVEGSFSYTDSGTHHDRTRSRGLSP